MRALLLETPGGPMRITEVPDPQPGPGEVIVAVRACGIGLTLLWTIQERWAGGSLPSKLPRIIGHEIAGDVIAVGDDVRHVRPGERVVSYYYLTCGACRYCALGRESLCQRLAGYVGRQIDGGFADLVALPERNVRHLPDGVTYEQGAVATDALATPFHVLHRRAEVRPTETVVVVGGAGGVGIHQVKLARALGAQVISVDVGPEKQAFALEHGAHIAIDATSAPFDDQVREHTGGLGADVVVEMVGTEATVGPSVRSLSPIGRLILVGTYEPSASLGLTVRTLTGEQSVMTSRYCTRSDLSESLDLIATGVVEPVITRRCGIDDVNATLDAIERREVNGRAVMLA